MTCDPTSLKPLNNAGTCVACQEVIPNCRTCTQATPTTIACITCKAPFTGATCERDCGPEMVQLNESNCQPFSVAFPYLKDLKLACSGGKYGEPSVPDANGDISCICRADKSAARHFTGPNCDRRVLGLRCKGGIVPVCAKCSSTGCADCIPGTQSANPASGCCNNSCKTCAATQGDFSAATPFPPSLCTACDADSERPVLKNSACIACADAIDGCLLCAQPGNGPARCTRCRDRLRGASCDAECGPGYAQFNVDFCAPATCQQPSKCSGRGSCVEASGGQICTCEAGFAGANCELNGPACEVENCESCASEGVCGVCRPNFKLVGPGCAEMECEDLIKNCEICDGEFPAFSCTICGQEFTGKDCRTRCENGYVQFGEDACGNISCATNLPCSGNGTCAVDEVGNNVCGCKHGFAGRSCEFRCDQSCASCVESTPANCTSCPDQKYLVDMKCVACSQVPNCIGCAQQLPDLHIKCVACADGFTGASCDWECPAGQLRYKTEFCQSASCETAVPCNGNGTCQLAGSDFLCQCSSTTAGPDCGTLRAGKRCGSGPEIKNCTKCTSGLTCAECFMGASLSSDALQCCARGCRGCESNDPDVCFGCDKGSAKPFYDGGACKTCTEVYAQCQLCSQLGFLNKVTCEACAAPFTGAQCDLKCAPGERQFNGRFCQPATCKEHAPCTGEGACVPKGSNMACECVRGVGGTNCELRPRCDVANCQLCTLHDHGACQDCDLDYTPKGGLCAPKTCAEALPNCASGCSGAPASFFCARCKPPFTGQSCEKSCEPGFVQYLQEHCQPETCETGCSGSGTCAQDASGNKSCSCAKNYSGINCENNCAEPCKTCTASKQVCTSCYGSFSLESSTCVSCAQKFPNCAECAAASPLACAKCAVGFTGASCTDTCALGTVQYGVSGCQPISCLSALPCQGQSACLAAGGDLKCTCKKDASGPNCEIHSGKGKTCNGYKILKCVACTTGRPPACAFCAVGYRLNFTQTECCEGHCTDCEMRAPGICTKCDIKSDFPFLFNGKCGSCESAIENCAKCEQADLFSAVSCASCMAQFTGATCETDCGPGMRQFNGGSCQSASCGTQLECSGNGVCAGGLSGDRMCSCAENFVGVNCEGCGEGFELKNGACEAVNGSFGAGKIAGVVIGVGIGIVAMAAISIWCLCKNGSRKARFVDQGLMQGENGSQVAIVD
uniref:Cysteine-rich membrane protein 2 n=1 Tax=Spironucleus salmonicida TaxID=348837 RepID=V6LHQ9_9EUKA|eukprot:EST44110.1 Cysteine-rich membrane protein 2 [Spironucleus salmonicida]